MNQAILKEVHKTGLKTVPEIRTGYTVKVHQKIKEGNKERIQIFEGLVIKTNSGTGLDSTFTVRKIASGVGVEKIFPLYSSNIAKIEVVKTAKIRRSKLYYMRERTGKSARLKETYLKAGEAKMIEHNEESAESKEQEAEADVAETPVVEVEATPEVAEAPAEEATPEVTETPAEEAEAPAEEKAEEETPAEEEKTEE